VFGGHWSDNPGWLLLTERDQDITRPLHFADNSVDMAFAEHVIEHVSFLGGLQFLRECFRVLKPGAVCRIICPMLDRLVTADFSGENGQAYVRNILTPAFVDENVALVDVLGLRGFGEEPRTFLFNAVYMGHGHRFIWTSTLMINVMTAIGFRQANRFLPGEGSRPSDCIERRRRGVYMGYEWREELLAHHELFDVESFVVEAIK
jgi:SAM-dependent methyltransferase